MANRFFREDETLSPRLVVITGIAAFLLMFALAGTGMFLGLILRLLALVLLVPMAYSALRVLVPLMDPRDAEADRIAVWGGFILVLLFGLTAFGVIALPALGIAAYVLWMRAPELLEVFEFFSTGEARD
ncbi:MAG: hypothetical protein AAFY59_07960 [Pseudomonadota bacterium]